MKDRLRQLMDSQHMNQQSFAALLGVAPATLSSILQERTRPTLNTVDAVRAKFPNVNLEWLIYGTGEMFHDPDKETKDDNAGSVAIDGGNDLLLFSDDARPAPVARQDRYAQQSRYSHASAQETTMQMKNIDKEQRKITEIRVYFDDQTWESFVPKK